ncbi:MAG: hypothetical protein DRP89_06265 [Candidatus Neomarinimicrobiota bacterium]|nr:MAG: hypothetical protein DRP89_06265 [Candidatus Neomarinimicrobiota bacterium]
MVISIHSIVDNVLHVLPIALLFYFALAVISAKTKNEISTGKNIRRYFLEKPLVNFNLKWNIIFPVVGILLLILNGYFTVNKTIGYVHWKNGQDEVHIGRWENGIYEYKRALNYLPDNGELQFHLGAAYSYIGKSAEAIRLLSQSLEKFSDKNIYLTLGHAYMISGEYFKAEECFKRLNQMYPQLLLPHLWLAEMYYYKLGSTEKAISELKFIIKAEPKIQSDDVRAIKRDARRFLAHILSK